MSRVLRGPDKPGSSQPRGARAPQGTQPAPSLWSWRRRGARKACRDGGVSGLGRGGSVWKRAPGESMSEERAVPASAASPEDFSSWPEELCRRELPTALPRLLISFAVAGTRGGAWGRGRPSLLGRATPAAGACCVPAAGALSVLGRSARRSSEGTERERGPGVREPGPAWPGAAALADGARSVTVGVGVAFSPSLCALKVFCARHGQLRVNAFARESGEARTRTRAGRRAPILSRMRPRETLSCYL